MTKIGIIGCGAIGSEIANFMCAGKAGDASLIALFDVVEEQARTLAANLPIKVPYYTEIDPFLHEPGMEMVVECASPAAVRAHAEAVLSHGKDLLMASSGALTDTALYKKLWKLSEENNLRMMIPSGALGGIDAIRAARDYLQEVTLTTSKPPAGLKGAPGFKDWEDKEITSAQVVFDGPAGEAVKLFPANVNVGATLSLAGLGPEKTKVKVVADPDSSGNVHQIYAKGEFGEMRFTMENVPHSRNPRTSYLAVLSLLETLRAACSSGPRVGT